MTVSVGPRRDPSSLRVGRRARPAWRPAPEAWWLSAAVVAFWGVSVWWLTQDTRVPDYDSGMHMHMAIVAHLELAHGSLAAPFTDYTLYPPLVHLLGAASVFVAGIHPMAMILSSNLVFVPALALGCYGTGRLVAGPRAGLLAGTVALGAPMVISMMHEYDLDPPQAAMVALTVWATLASRRFASINTSAGAGLLLGLAMLTKQTTVVFVAGLLAVVLVRGGWRHRRGLFAFVACAILVAGPWYAVHFNDLRASFTQIGELAPDAVQAPPRWSVSNLLWYFWNLVNEQTLTIIAGLALIGAVLAIGRIARRRLTEDDVGPELLAGAVVSYLGMTFLTHKDPRYTLPMLVYIAVLATYWMVRIRRPAMRRLLQTGTVLLVGVYLIGVSAGIGGWVKLRLPGARTSIIYPHQLTVYETQGWVRGGPVTDGHVLALMEGLHRMGIRRLRIDTGPDAIDFNANGLLVLALTAHITMTRTTSASPQSADMFVHRRGPGDPAPCQTLNDGMGIYVARAASARRRASGAPAPGAELICPSRVAS